MRRRLLEAGLVTLTLTAFAVTACGVETKSHSEAVDSARAFIELTGEDTTDEAVEDFLWRVCDWLDEKRPGTVADALDKAGYAPITVDMILENASQGFCPEHIEAVFELTGGS